MHFQLPAGAQLAALMALSSPSWSCCSLRPIHHLSARTIFPLHRWSATGSATVCRPVEGVLKPLVAHLQQAGQLAGADEAFYRMNVSKLSCTSEVECYGVPSQVHGAQAPCQSACSSMQHPRSTYRRILVCGLQLRLEHAC